MVASTVYQFEDHLTQICGVLKGFGFEVWNSHLGTIPVHPGRSNLENCLQAVRDCDLVVGIIRGNYGSGIVGPRSITHEEISLAVGLVKPRWFLVHENVTLARQLLKPYMFKRNGTATKFKLKKNSVIDDLRVIAMYNDAIQSGIAVNKRKGHWVQQFSRQQDALDHLNIQFKDMKRIRQICAEMTPPPAPPPPVPPAPAP
jgi:hypothetical protein